MEEREKPNNRIRTNQKSCYEYLLSCKVPPIESPIKGKTIKQFHCENLRFARKCATLEQANKIHNKYAELDAYFLSRENEYRNEAIILKNIAAAKDTLDNYHGEALLRLYLYFNNLYRYQASFLGKEINILGEIFKTINLDREFKGLYLLEFKTEIARCLKDVINEEHVLSLEEAVFLDSEYQTQDRDTKGKIRKALSISCRIGRSIGLSDSELKKEFTNLYYFIIENSSENRFSKPFDIVDMYLTTNIQPEDFSRMYSVGLPSHMISVISKWFKETYVSMFEKSLGNPLFDSSRNIVLEMCKPSIHIVKEFINNSFGLYAPIEHNTRDLERAYFVLCDLNKKYGVKYDHFTFMAVLRSVVWGEDSSYYALGNKYKEALDNVSHIVNKGEPVFTRREKNDAK